MHFAHGNESGQEVGLLLRIRLMDDALIALPGSPGFIGINSGNQNQLVLYFFIYFRQPADVIADGIFIVCRAGADNDEKLTASTGDHSSDFGISLPLDFRETRGKRMLLSDLLRGGQMGYKLKAHSIFFAAAILSVKSRFYYNI